MSCKIYTSYAWFGHCDANLTLLVKYICRVGPVWALKCDINVHYIHTIYIGFGTWKVSQYNPGIGTLWASQCSINVTLHIDTTYGVCIWMVSHCDSNITLIHTSHKDSKIHGEYHSVNPMSQCNYTSYALFFYGVGIKSVTPMSHCKTNITHNVLHMVGITEYDLNVLLHK